MRDSMLILHFIGLAMALGAGFSSLTLSLVAGKMPKEEAQAFTKKTLSLIYLAKTGVIILLVSGAALMTPYWSQLKTMPTLHVKFTLVLLLLINLIIHSSYAKKVKAEGGEKHFPKLKILARTSLALGLCITILAVLTFH
jgi:uncharacterized membrane protein